MDPTRRTSCVIMLGLAQTLGWGTTYYLPAILAAPMADDLGIGVGAVFAAFSGALIASALLGPLAGRMIDHNGGRGALTLSSMVFAAGLATLALAQGFPMLLAGWLLLGVGMSFGLYEAAFATLVAALGRDARGPITGVTLIAGFASTVCWPLTALMDAELGWRGACLVWAAAHLLVGLPLNMTMPRGSAAIPPAAGAEADTGGGAREAGAPPAQNARFAMALMAFVFTATWFTSTAMAAHLPRIFQDLGATPVAAIAAAALVGPAQVAARLLEFGLMRRAHPLLSARLAASAHPVAAMLLLGLGAPGVAAFALLHGGGNGIMTIAKGTLPLAVFGPSGYGARQGWLSAPARFGQAAAPFVFALALDAWGAGALWVTAGLMGAALLGLLALQGARV